MVLRNSGDLHLGAVGSQVARPVPGPLHGPAFYLGPVLRHICRVQQVVLVCCSSVVGRKCGGPCTCMAKPAPSERRPDVSPGGVVDLERCRLSRTAVHEDQRCRLAVRGPVHHGRGPVVLGGHSEAARVAVPDRSDLRPRDSAGVLCAGVSLLQFWDWPRYPEIPTFGVPCPTAILTIGVLLAVRGGPPLSLAVIPAAWAFIGGSAALLFGVWTDYMLLVAGVSLVGYLVMYRGDRNRP